MMPTVNNDTNNKINNIPSSSSSPPMAPNQNNAAVALRCPRCDSSNTKFCYYNNYSLTQPRHFCKSCKRYWTRGGTLRNVPVGGGCRKNKRHKRSTPASASVAAATAVSADPAKSSSLFSALAANNNNNNSSENVNLNSFLFGLPSAAASTSGMNQYVSYELQPQMSSLGIGCSDNNQFQLGFGTSMQQSGTFLNDYSSTLLPYQDLQASASESFRLQREVKIETGNNVTEPWQIPYPYAMNPLEALAGSGDYSYPYWNSPDVKNSSIAGQLF